MCNLEVGKIVRGGMRSVYRRSHLNIILAKVLSQWSRDVGTLSPFTAEKLSQMEYMRLWKERHQMKSPSPMNLSAFRKGIDSVVILFPSSKRFKRPPGCS